MFRLVTRPSPTLIIAIVALIVSLTGTAAAAQYVITSSSQIKPGAVSLKNLSPSAQTSLKGAQGLAGANGPAGAPGAAGANGPVGLAGHFSAANVTRVVGNTVTLCAAVGSYSSCRVGGSAAKCLAGGIVLGGGWTGGGTSATDYPPVDAGVGDNQPSADNTGWIVIMGNHAPISATFTAWAMCATPQTGAHARLSLTSHDQAQVRQQIEQLRHSFMKAQVH